MSTLVTGGTGFVGVNIVRELARAQHDVVSFDLNPPDQLTRDFLASESAQVSFVTGDMLDQAALSRLAQDYTIDRIVHAAVYTVNRTELETRRSRDVIDINITGTANLLEMARELSVSRFLYVSSGAVYGDARVSDQTFNEDDAPRPQNLYGITKLSSELLTRRYGELHGISTASARLSTPYGPMERVTGHRAVMSVFYHLIGQAAREEPLNAGAAAEGRDYTYVTDIADGVRAILDAPNLPHDLYNVTAGIWITPQEILAALGELVPSARLEPGLTADGPDVAQTGRGPLSAQRLAQDLGWRSGFDLASGLTEYLDWRRNSGFLE